MRTRAREIEPTEDELTVLRLFREGSYQSAYDLADRLGLAVSVVGERLKALRQKGYVRRVMSPCGGIMKEY
jgi:DNA-binding MarR family transcriptional regulator